MSLRDYDRDYAAAPTTPATEHDKVPDGPYRVRTESAEMRTSKAGEPRLTLGLRITEGPHARRMLWMGLLLRADPNFMGRLKASLTNMGLADVRPSDLERPETLARMTGLDLDVQANTGTNGYQNVRIKRLAEPAPYTQHAPVPTGDDDIPF